MKGWNTAAVLAFTALTGLASPALAQESGAIVGKVEVSIIPGGGFFFTENTEAQEPSFGNYDLGGRSP